MAEPIEIIIRQGGQGGAGLGSGTGGAVSGSRTIVKEEQKSDNLLARSVITNQFVDALKNQTKAAIMYAIGNYGNMTGDYIGQQQINNALGFVSDITTIAAGFVYGGWVGGIIATGTIAFNKAEQIVSFSINVAKQNTNASYMRERSGNSLNNGSSGTYE